MFDNKNSAQQLKLLTGCNRMSHVSPILCFLHWFPLKVKTDFKAFALIDRILHSQTPVFIIVSRVNETWDQDLLIIL